MQPILNQQQTAPKPSFGSRIAYDAIRTIVVAPSPTRQLELFMSYSDSIGEPFYAEVLKYPYNNFFQNIIQRLNADSLHNILFNHTKSSSGINITALTAIIRFNIFPLFFVLCWKDWSKPHKLVTIQVLLETNYLFVEHLFFSAPIIQDILSQSNFWNKSQYSKMLTLLLDNNAKILKKSYRSINELNALYRVICIHCPVNFAQTFFRNFQKILENTPEVECATVPLLKDIKNKYPDMSPAQALEPVLDNCCFESNAIIFRDVNLSWSFNSEDTISSHPNYSQKK